MQSIATQREALPNDIKGLLRRLGEELCCSICLNVFEDPVMTPCNHTFCRECIERAVALTKKGSAVPLNQCPICKGKTPKRSLNPSQAAARLAALYEQIATAYSEALGGDEDWMHEAGIRGSESYYTSAGQPLENLSQLYPYPEKPAKSNSQQLPPLAEEEPEIPSSPLIPASQQSTESTRFNTLNTQDYEKLLEMNDSIAEQLAELDRKLAEQQQTQTDSGFNTLAALDNIELPSTPDIFVKDKHRTSPKEILKEKSRALAKEIAKEKSTTPEKENISNSNNSNAKDKKRKSDPSSPKAKKSNPSSPKVKKTNPSSPKTKLKSNSSSPKTKKTKSMQPVETSTPSKPSLKTIKVEAISTPVKKQPPSTKMILSTSGIKGNDLLQLTKFSDQFVISVVPDLTSCTHLILATNDQLIVQKRTIKYFEALLQPAKYTLVSSLWIDACLRAKKLVSFDKFIISGDSVNSRPENQKFKKSPSPLNSLFACHRFHLYGTFSQPPPDQLEILIKLTGSEVIHDVNQITIAAKSHKCMILVDATSQVDYEQDAGIIRRYPILSATWILDCISCRRVLDYKEYLLL